MSLGKCFHAAYHLHIVYIQCFSELEKENSFSQTSTRVSITVWKHGKCFLFLKYIAELRYKCITFAQISFTNIYFKNRLLQRSGP